MQTPVNRALSTWLFVAVATAPLAAQAAQPTVLYNRDVRPILSAACFQCHGPDAHGRKAGRRLDTFAGATADQKGVRALVPGDPAASELLRRVSHPEGHKKRMPPVSAKKPALTPAQIQVLRTWIQEGGAYQEHWAFLPVAPTPVPAGTAASPIDRFVAARRAQAGLPAAPEQDRRRLIRRVTFDLTGLPPQPSDVEAFVADRRPDAYERVVDRLLASPAYGERMAASWMDAARYGDTSAYHADGPRQMWAWRDWVIDAFRENMPYDQFTIEQLAGDLLPGATVAQKVAAGFNRNHCTSDEGGAFPEELRVGYVVDRVRTTSMVWMGLTMECAQCHSHKYDPISHRDYYSFFAFFNQTEDPGMQTRGGNQKPLIGLLREEQRKALPLAKREIAALKEQIAAREKRAAAPFAAWLQQQPEHATVSADGLRVHYPLDANFADVAVRGATPRPRIHGKVRWVPARAGQGLHCDGTTRIELGDRADFDRTDAYTVSLWVKPTSRSIGAVVGRMNPSNSYRGWDVSCAGGQPVSTHLIHLWTQNAIKVTTKKKLPLKKWSHVCVTYDGSSKARGFRIYVNGVHWPHRVERDALRGTSRSKVPLTLGDRFAAYPFRGQVDDLKIYRRAVSAVEAAILAGEDPVGALRRTPIAKRVPAQVEAVRAVFLTDTDPTWRRLRAELAKAEEKKRKLEIPHTTVMTMGEMRKPRPTFVLNRGAYDQPTKERVQPDVPAAVLPLGDRPRNRLGLAKWLIDPRNPLTARVTVNRFWHQVFGRGLVETVEDFGAQGANPSHPRLLDWLAADFVANGWNVKRLMRQLVTSATYRQAARVEPAVRTADPENILLSRGPRLRLDAEFVRDAALSVSGLLVDKVGGPGVKPYQPPGLWNEVSLNKNVRFRQDHGEKLYRKSLYTYWKRSAPPPAMRIFDAPTRERCVLRRGQTNTPLQALVTLNDPQFLEAARFLAERTIRDGGEEFVDRVTYAYRLVLARPPAADECAILQSAFDDLHREYTAAPARAARLLAVGEGERDARIPPPEHAAWMILASMILNLDEALTK